LEDFDEDNQDKLNSKESVKFSIASILGFPVYSWLTLAMLGCFVSGLFLVNFGHTWSFCVQFIPIKL